MHLLIPFASGLSPAAAPTLGTLNLPHLSKLLTRLSASSKTGGDEYSFSTPHEVAIASVWRWTGGDGALPWAARLAQMDALNVDKGAWGLLTPAHWQVGRDHITMADPQSLKLTEAESKALFEALRPLFADDGWTLHWGAAERWYASHPSLADLRCASLDRVAGRNIDVWLPNTPQVKTIRRLQSEAQMLLYAHPLFDDRQARGELPVNSFWLSGCGVHQPIEQAHVLQIDDRLRAPLLAEDWATWAETWAELDASALADLLRRAQRGETVSLTLCGERFYQRFDTPPPSLWRRLSRTWQSPAVAPMLEAL